MTNAAALDRLMNLGGELVTISGQQRRKFDLAHMRALLGALGDPHLRFPSLLIAGTNGKGSTAATLASILRAAGYTTGLYTSPHLSRINERIRLMRPGTAGDDAQIEDDDLFRYFAQVEVAAEKLIASGSLPSMPSFFETVTAIAMLAFAQRPVEIAVLEVGMGGRLDATNVVDPLLSIITDISLDHTEWLGPTIDAIAREKAGILRPGGIMITLPQHPEANYALGEVAVPLGVVGINAAEFLPGRGSAGLAQNLYELSIDGEALVVDSPLSGEHQQRNLALAIAAAISLRNKHGYNIRGEHISQGIRETCWPGRIERLITPSGTPLILDVAHNPAGAWALRASVSHLSRPHPLVLIFGCMRDKAVGEIAQILFPLFHHVLLVELPSPRTAAAAELVVAAERTGADHSSYENISAALGAAEVMAGSSGLIVGSGSLVLVGGLRDLLVRG